MDRRGENRVGRRERTSDPTSEPVTVAEVKQHTRVDITADDAYLSGLIQTARKHVERRSNRALITQTWKLYLDDFPTGEAIRLMPAPVQSVASVEYTDTDGTTSTFAASNYIVDTVSEPARVVLKQEQQWPSTTLERANAVAVTFDAGYGDNASDVPRNLRHAIMLLVAHWYEHREAVTTGTVPREMERAVGDLIADERVRVMA